MEKLLENIMSSAVLKLYLTYIITVNMAASHIPLSLLSLSTSKVFCFSQGICELEWYPSQKILSADNLSCEYYVRLLTAFCIFLFIISLNHLNMIKFSTEYSLKLFKNKFLNSNSFEELKCVKNVCKFLKVINLGNIPQRNASCFSHETLSKHPEGLFLAKLF